MTTARKHVDDLRGASRLAIEATTGLTGLVEAMHNTIGGGPALLRRPLERPVRLVTGVVYGTIRTVTRIVGAGIDAALSSLAPLLGESTPTPEREAVLAALNGVLGDYLADSGNPLALEARLRHGGIPLSLEREALSARFPAATAKLAVLIHGSCMNDLQWNRHGHDHGTALARDLGYSPVYAHYNTGQRISTNGHALAELLERLFVNWPVALEEIVFIGHSMGGLVARAVCHAGETSGHHWRRRLRKLVTLGSPHQGAPLERAGHWLELLLGISRYSAPLAQLGRIRSAGIIDLRFGNVLDRPLPLPTDIAAYAIAATLSPGGSRTPRGDGLVPVASALGRHARRPERTLAFPPANQWIATGMGHVDLLGRPAVYATLRAWMDS